MANLFDRLFRRRNSSTTDESSPAGGATAARSDAATLPLGLKTEIPTTPMREALVDAPRHPQIEVGYAQSVGRQRDHNEDALLVINSVISANGALSSFGLYVVADGMGGHKQGEVASELAVRTMAAQITQKIMLAVLGPQPAPPKESIQEIVDHSILEVHRLITKEAPGSGTTLTALLLMDKRVTIAHVGDSRAYAIQPGGELQVLTRDHSLVMRMMELGQLTEEEAAVHPQRNVLYRALGQGEAFAPDISTSPLPETGYLMVCSDGLWGVVPKEDMARIITESASPQIACHELVDAANDSGGPDNISVILIRLPG